METREYHQSGNIASKSLQLLLTSLKHIKSVPLLAIPYHAGDIGVCTQNHEPTDLQMYSELFSQLHPTLTITAAKHTVQPILHILQHLPLNLLLLSNPNRWQHLYSRRAFRAYFLEKRQPCRQIFRAMQISKEDADCAGVFDGLVCALATEGEHLYDTY